MERRYARELRERTAEEAGPDVDPDAETDRMDSVDVRAFAAPPAHTEARVHDPAHAPERAPGPQGSDRQAHDRRTPRQPRTSGSRRTARRTTAGPVSAPRRPAAPGPAPPAHRSRRRRAGPARPALPGPGTAQTDDDRPLPGLHPRRDRGGGRRTRLPLGARRPRRPAEHVHRASAGPGAAPVRLHHGPPPGRGRGAAAAREPAPRAPARRLGPRRAGRRLRSPPPGAGTHPHGLPQEAGRRALVEQTDHAEWVDQQRDRDRVQGDSWEPVPVPLPTYVTAPVAPGPPAASRSATRRPGARPAPAPPSPPARAPRTPRWTRPRASAPTSPAAPATGAGPPLRPVRRRGPAPRGQRVSPRNPDTADQRRNGFPSTPVRVLEFHSLQGPVAQSGSAPRSHRGGLGFKSPQVHARRSPYRVTR